MPGGEKFRGSSEIPLTGEGVDSARNLAIKLSRKGGLDEIHTSSMGRTVHTARILSKYTGAPITYSGDGLHPWHLGGLEGKEITPELLDYQKRLITDTPDEGIPGRGPVSSADGESFNSFKTRTLSHLKKVLTLSSTHPEARIGVVTHYRVKKLLDSWLRKGADPDGDIDTTEMTQHNSTESPGSVDHLVVDPYAGPQMFAVDPDSPGRLGGGVYFVRHEKTPWNSGSAS